MNDPKNNLEQTAAIQKGAEELVQMRKARGVRLAKSRKVEHVAGDLWAVPSQDSAAKYSVDLKTLSCSCPDYELHRAPCKHVFAAEHARDHNLGAMQSAQSAIATEVVEAPKRKTYGQNWPAYNKAQSVEKDLVQILLQHLCSTITQPPRGNGRPYLPWRHVVFALAMKVFIGFSGRRATSDIRACWDVGLINVIPHWNTIARYLNKEALTPILKTLIQRSAAPLAALEEEFVVAVDATGFTSSRYGRWYDPKTGKTAKQHGWVKLHAMVGTRTNIVIAAEVTYGVRGDSLEFVGLVTTGSEVANIAEVTADKAYLGNENLEAVTKIGATPFIPFKLNSIAENGGPTWRKMFHYFSLKRDEFMAHYHRRSNVESTFSMIKRKFSPTLRSVCHRAQINETLAKVLCHNLSVLVHEVYERGINPADFLTPLAAPLVKGGPTPTLAEAQTQEAG